MRLSRNVRVYLPFWAAVPAWLIAAVVWACWLVACMFAYVARGLWVIAARTIRERRKRPGQ